MTETETAAVPDDPTDDQLRQAWITILAEHWRTVDWEQFGQQQKRRATTFDERAEVATRAADVHGALDRLAKGLNMAAPELPTRDLDILVADDGRAMQLLEDERIWLVNKANETVRNYFDAMDSDDDSDPEPTTSELTDFISTEGTDD